MYLEKIISGGQTGADIAGLKAAKHCGLKTGGMMPQGWRTLDGAKPEYKELYGMVESGSPSYKGRTFWNAKVGDATVRFASDFNSPGEKCTLNAINKWQKPRFDINILNFSLCGTLQTWQFQEFLEFLDDNKVKTLNVAGNSEQTSPGIEQEVYNFLVRTIHQIKYNDEHTYKTYP